MAGAPLLQSRGNAFGGAGIGEAGGANLDSGGSGEKELNRVLGRADAAEANDRNRYGLRRFPNHTDSDGFDGRPGEAAGDVPEARAA